jgi:DNA modification methylase
MQIEQWALPRITPYPGNPRINDDAVEAVAASIREFGFRQPIVVDDDNVIIVGHTRYKAALKLGLTQAPVHVATGLSPEQVKAYRIADNQTATIAEWDFDLLPIELLGLESSGFDLGLLGFSAEELAQLLAPDVQDGLCDPDDVPAPPDEAITQSGDLWILGDHRLLCGDSSSPEDLDRLLDGHLIHLVNTDPPYNVKVEPRSNNAHAAGTNGLKSLGQKRKTTDTLRAKDRPLANDFVSDEVFDRLVDAWFSNISRVLLPGRAFYIWGGGYPGSGGAKGNHETYPQFMRKHELKYAQLIIWDKQHPVLTRKDYMGAHESCFYGWKEGAAHKYYGPDNATDLWHIKKIPPQQLEHLTGKPAELAVRAMQYSSIAGENVLDLFGGSGSTLIGAERCGRHAFLMELDTLYCDVIVDRFQRFTGIPAVLERTGDSPIPMKTREENMR